MHLVNTDTLNHLSFRFIRTAICVALMTMLMVVFSDPAFAQIDPTSCGHFESQEAAQAHFDTYDLEFPDVLDPDGDGIACEFAFGGDGLPAVFDPVSCGHFESQEAAQEHFDTYDLEFPGVLDPDEDGIACEFAFGGDVTEPAYVASQVTALPSTGAGQGSSPESEGGFAPIVAVILMLITWAAALTRHHSSR